jgi:uroporphyrinogen-III synthase
VLEAPAIATVPAWDPAELAAVRGNLASGGYAWIVLPSHNAARDLVDHLRHGRVVCGAATAQALGLQDALTLDRFSAVAALERLRPLVRPGARMLVPRAAESRDELTDGLVALGADVHAPIAYRTEAVEPTTLAAQLGAGEVNAITVCSPSALQSLLMAVGREALLVPRLICLGETTAQAARDAGLRVDGVARRTSMASLVEAVEAPV